jgi:hypothetical protein
MRMVILFLAAALASAQQVQQYHSHDFAFRAQAQGNPFDVDVWGEFTGPGGRTLRLPGFYDGEGTWKIRFSPTATGAWTLKTVSSLPALNGQTGRLECVPNTHPRIHGSLRVDPAHPYHFVYEDGTRYFLLGYEADWLWGIETQDPERREQKKLIAQMASRGFNHVLVNIYAHDTGWSPERRHKWDFGPPDIFPWEGTNLKPDHSHLNVRFFQLYDRMMESLRDAGIVAHIMLKVYNKRVNWPERGSENERRYFRYVAARYQAFSNVVWDYSKESYNEKDDALQARLLEYVRSLDAYRRLTTAHDDDAYEWNPAYAHTLDFRTDQQHTDFGAMIALDRAMRKRPVVNSEFGYERGVDKMPTYRIEHDWEEQLRRAWLVYLAGGYGVYYYHNTAWDVVKVEPEPPGMQRFQLLRQTLEALPYWKMEPADHLAAGGPCLAIPGQVYAVFVEGRNVAVNLLDLEGEANAEWVNTWSGERLPQPVQARQVVKLNRPEAFGKAPAVLLVRNVSQK